MNLLFVHQNMPGQFKHLAARLAADPANRVVFVTNREGGDLPGVERRSYKLPRRAGESTSFYIRLFENSVIYGQRRRARASSWAARASGPTSSSAIRVGGRRCSCATSSPTRPS